jgi:hypothetical protein
MRAAPLVPLQDVPVYSTLDRFVQVLCLPVLEPENVCRRQLDTLLVQRDAVDREDGEDDPEREGAERDADQQAHADGGAAV